METERRPAEYAQRGRGLVVLREGAVCVVGGAGPCEGPMRVPLDRRAGRPRTPGAQPVSDTLRVAMTTPPSPSPCVLKRFSF